MSAYPSFSEPQDPDSSHKLNKISFGIAAGVAGPVIGFWLYYLMQFSIKKSPAGFIQMVLSTPEIQPKILSLALIFNLALFFILLKFDFRSFAMGVLYATFAYVPVVLLLKYF